MGDHGHVGGEVEPPVAAARQPVNGPIAAGHLDRCGAVVGGEVVLAGAAIGGHRAGSFRIPARVPELCAGTGAASWNRRLRRTRL